ncbi:MAG: Ig-like domain-containing protein, partial [Verrucomicrobiota bacterium]
PPTLTVAYPTLEENVSNAVITATGKAVDNVAVSNVFCALNGSDWFVASSTNKWTNWFASGLNLRPGSNNFQAWAMDTSGNCSPTDTVKFVYIVSAPLSVSINGSGTISPDYNGAILQIGKDYSMTARAASGFAFTGWTGSIVTNSATLKFMMESNLAFTANFRDTISPTLTITYPAANQRVSNAVATVTGKAGDNVGVAGVWYQLNGEGWNPAATTNHYTNWTSPVLALAQGTNIVSAFAADAAGNVSLTNTVKFVCTGAVVSSVFPIVTNGTDTSASVAFDGTNYLVGIQGDYVSSNAYQITAQMFGPAGQTIGARISPVPGHTGGNPAVACSGANYLMVWPDDYLGGNNSSLCGQIVSPLGALVGSWFPITTNSAQNRPEAAYGSGEYLVVWEDYSSGNNWAIYGQLVSLTGALVGSEMLICAPTDGQDEKGGAVAFDGANFLVVWQLNSTASGDHNVTYGVFVSPSGTMGTPFAIGQTVSRDRNPLNLVFNGTDYFVVWNYDSEVDNEGNPIWSLYGRFVSPAGGFSGNEFAILTNGVPRYPALAFDGVNYLLCWNQGWATANSDVQFQYLNSSGRPFGSQFTPFSAQGNQLPLLASLLFDGKRFVAVATLSAGAFTPSPTDNADVYGAFIPEPDTSADWAPDSLSGWEANINVTEPQAKQFDTSFGGDTFAQFGSGTNWENYGVGTYAYTKLASNVAQIGLTYTEPTYGTNSTVVDLTFTSKTSVTFTYVSTDNTGSGAMTLSRLTNSVQIPSVRMNASTTSSAGNGTNAGTYDPNGTFSMASGGWGTFTVAQYSPVARLRILNFSDPGEAGLILYNQTQFATPTSGDYFIQIFTDTNSPPVYTDVGTFTANDDWAPVSLAGFTATLTNGITMSWGDDTFAQFGSDTNIYEYGVGTNSYAKIGTNAARVVSFFIAPPTDADIYPSNATVSTITFTSPSTANFSWKNLSGSGSGTGTFTGVTNTAPASLAGKTVYFTESGENGYTTAVFGDQTATFTDPNATVSSGPYTYMAVSPIAGMLQITWTSGDNAGDTGYAEISFTSSMAGGFFHADYGTNGTLAKVGIGTFTMP